MISSSQARAIAQTYLFHFLRQPDPMLRPWREAVLGDPLLVRTVDLEPSHWIVPVLFHGSVLGGVEVTLDGRVAGHSYFYRNPEDLSVCPAVTTRISSQEALQQAEGILSTYVGAEFSEPVFVFNGFRDRLAWMIQVRMGGKLVSRVFVTPGYVYERRAGKEHPPTGWRGSRT